MRHGSGPLLISLREVDLARLFVIVGGFIVAVLMAALVAPLFINWTNYRADFEAQASAILGRPVTVAGEASARLLPFPSVTFNDVRVGDDPAKPVLKAERFSMDAELAPFLSGEVLIFDMRVTKPEGVVSVNEDGVVDWTLRPQAPVDASHIRIENLVVENGSFTVEDQRAKRTHQVANLQMVVSARTLTGPWRLNGTADFDGEPLALSLTTGTVSEKGELPLAMRAIPSKRGFVVEADGTAKSEAGTLSWLGGFTVRQSQVSDGIPAGLKDGNGGAVPMPPLAPAWLATGKFALGADKLDLPEVRLETGTKDNPYISNGKGMVLFGPHPMFDLTLDGAQVTFAETDEAEFAGADRLTAIRETLNAIPLPDMKGTVNFNLPALVAGDTTVRDIGFAATPENGAWRVRGFHATLPGRTRVEADGLLGTGERFGFEGRLTVASNQPAGFSNWLTGNVDASIRNLKALGLAADVALTPGRQIFRNLELAIDASVFNGDAERRTDGVRPSIRATLSGGALPLSALAALGAGMISPEGASRFGGHDVALTLDAGPISDGAMAADTLGLTVRLKEDRLDVDRLMIGNLAGSTISATGVAENLRAAVRIEADASLISEDAAPFVNMLAAQFPQPGPLRSALERFASVPELLKDIQANLVASSASEGGIRALTASYTARTAGGEQSLTGTLSGEGFMFSPGDVSARATISDDDPGKLLQLAGIPVLPVDLDGPAEATFTVGGRLTDGLTVKANYEARDTKANWDGSLTKLDNELRASGELSIESADFDPYLQASGLIFAGTGTGTPVLLRAMLDASGSGVSLRGLSLKVSDAFLSGDVMLDVTAQRPKLTGSMKAQSVDGLLFAESLFGPSSLSGLNAAFPAGALIPIDADMELSANVMSVPPFGDVGDFVSRFTADGIGMRLSGIKGKIGGGVVGGTLEARNDAGTGTVTGDITLTGAQISALTGQTAAGGKADFAGSFSGSAKSMDGLIAALAGSGVVKLEGAALSGLNPDGFAPIARLAERLEKAPLAGEVTALIEGPVKDGAFPLSSEPMAWSLGGGKFKIASIRSTEESAQLEAALEADLAGWSALLAGVMSYDAGSAAVSGAEPQVPFRMAFDAERSSFETDPQPLTQFLTQTALEREQARVEAMQASLIEKQRLRRDVRRIVLLYADREKRSSARESAVRAQRAREAAVMLDAWKKEEARLAAEAKAKLEAEEQAAKAAEQAAAEKAAEEAAKLAAPGFDAPGLETPPLSSPQDDTLKWLKLKLN